MAGRRRATSLTLACLCAVAGASWAAPDAAAERARELAWKNTVKEAGKARDRREFDVAHETLTRALELAEGLEDRVERVPETLDKLAWLYHRQHKYPEAIEVCEEAVAFRSRHSETPLVGDQYCRYGLRWLYEQVEAWEEAEAFVRRRIEQLRIALGPDEWKVASELGALAQLLRKIRPEDPEIETLLLRVRTLADEDQRAINASTSLGSFYSRRGRHEEAVAAYEEALDLAVGLHPESAYPFRKVTLARQYQALGKYDRAEALLREAIEVQSALVGADQLSVSGPLYRLGMLFVEQERYPEAEPHLRRAVEIADANVGTDHEGYDYQRRDLRRVRAALGLLSEEALLADEESDEECKCPYDARRVTELLDRGGIREARSLVEDGLAQAEATYGPDSLEVAEVLGKLGSIRSQRSPEEAIALYERGLSILWRQLPVEDRRIAETANRLLTLYSGQRDHDTATEYGLMRIESLRAAGGRDFLMAKALEKVADLRRSADDEVGALEYYQLAAAAWASVYGKESGRHLDMELDMAYSYVKLRHFETAESWLLGLHERLEALERPDPREVKRVLQLLTRVYEETGRTAEAREARRLASSY